MTDALVHRGPDGEGLYEDRGVFLGHRRLAILDIEGGAQPMWNADQTVGVVYNGEIYNHLELRAELEGKGRRFRTDHSDTEVLVHGWLEWGSGLAERLNGMFAFAIYDRPRRQLFLARDRFGEKPLFYMRQGDIFAFASELTAISAHGGLHCAPEVRSLQKYFAYGYIPAPNALYRDARKLPGGCHLTFDCASGALRVERYWKFRVRPEPAMLRAGEENLAEELRHLLGAAVNRRLMSDVPLGVFLSGGVDSSGVLALARDARPGETLEAFTIGFTEPSYDESEFARQAARQVGAAHHLETMDLQVMLRRMDGVLGHLDEPLGDASILPTQQLCAFTRRHVTVALSGDGGDELFAGYDPFNALGPASLYERLVPKPLHGVLRRVAEHLPRSGRNMSFDFKVRRALAGLTYPRRLWNPVWLGPLEPEVFAEVFEQPLQPEDLYAEALAVWEDSEADDMVDRTLEFYTNLYLQDDILMKVDRAAMSVSLESRAVFLDNDVVAFCQRLPHVFKLRNGQSKYLLKKALAPLLPASILERRKKGFGIPLASWLCHVTPALLEDVPEIRADAVARRWKSHRQGGADHRLFLFSALSLEHVLSRGKRDRATSSPRGSAT